MFEGIMDYIHGGGHLIHELFVPSWNVSFNNDSGTINVFQPPPGRYSREQTHTGDQCVTNKLRDVEIAACDAIEFRKLFDAHRLKLDAQDNVLRALTELFPKSPQAELS